MPFGFITFVDYERDKEINFGVNYKWSDLGPDECVLSSDWKQYGIQAGMKINYAANYQGLFSGMAQLWNFKAALDSDLP